MKRPRWWVLASALAGAAAGYAYYYYVGCRSGACLITGNPWISTLYGAALASLLASFVKRSPPTDAQR